jgi:hypothetical protein
MWWKLKIWGMEGLQQECLVSIYVVLVFSTRGGGGGGDMSQSLQVLE